MRGRWIDGGLVVFAIGLWLWSGAGDAPEQAFQPVSRLPGILRVVTWNVGGSTGQGHTLRWKRVRHVADTLKTLEPDLVFLQEVGSDRQVEAIRRRLGAEWKFVTTPYARPRAATLYRGGSVDAWNAGARGSRPSLVAIYRSAAFPPIATINLHASTYNARRRNRTIGRAVRILDGRTTAPHRILAGDFNLDVDPDTKSDLFSDNPHRDIETYNYVAERYVDAGLHAGNTAEPDRRLDYIFVTAGLFRVVRAGPWKGRRRGDMDHHPVVADLVVRPARMRK